MENEKIIAEQKAEIERLTKMGDDFRQEVITLNIEKLELQKQVNELTEENKRLSIKVWNYEKPARVPLYSNESMVNCNLLTCYNENTDLRAENAELQKKVGKLKAENIELYKERTALIAGSILAKQNIAKDTAKEILGELDLFFKGTTFKKGYEFKKINEKLKELAKNNGVEVE